MVLDGVADHIGFLRTVGDVPKPEGRFLLSLNNPLFGCESEQAGNLLHVRIG